MNKSTLYKAMEVIQRRDLTLRQKGNVLVGIIGAVGGVALGILLLVVIALVISSFQSTITLSNASTPQTTPAWYLANQTLTMLVNMGSQFGLAGTIFGFVLVFGGLTILGYYGYQVTQGRGAR